MKPPYPYFGGKAAVAALVWSRLGDVKNYIEPFFGGGAVLLARPETHTGHVETVNDINGWLCNFWRAVKHDPDAVGAYASDPVNELDLHARGDWLFYRPDALDFVERLRGDPDYYCAKSAGWWVWGMSAWIGSGWGHEEKRCDAGRGVNRKLPHLGDAGMGVNRQLPHLGAGRGVNRQLPHLGNAGRGGDITDTTRKAAITEYMRQLCERMARVRVCCGDWQRVCKSDTTTVHHGLTGVFLDPPYAVKDRDIRLYGDNDSVTIAHEVREYALIRGEKMRIALCGYDEHDKEIPNTWERVAWKTNGGYGCQGKGRGRVNRHREVIYFSPACIKCDTIFTETKK